MKTNYRLPALAMILWLVFILSCKKDSTDETVTPGPQDDVTASNLVISPDAFVINDSLMAFDKWGSNPENGKYRYSCPGIIPDVPVGAVIVDTANGGYIRRITSKSVQGKYLTLQTTQALLSDIFESGGLSFTLDPGPATGLKSAAAGKTIRYQEGKSTLGNGVTSSNKVDIMFDSQVAAGVSLSGSFKTEPKIRFDFLFSKAKGVEKFSCSLAQTKLILQATAELDLGGSASYTIGKELCKFERGAWFYVSGIPVKVNLEFLTTVMGYVSFQESASFPVTFTNTSTLDYGINFANGQVTYNTGFTNKPELSGVPSFTAKGQLHVEVVPQITIQFYGVLSTVIKPKPYVDLAAQYTNEGGTQQICAQVDGGIDLGLGVSAELFGTELFNVSKDFSLLKQTLWKSLEGCEIPRIRLSDPTYGPGTNSCDPDFIPYKVSVNIEDPNSLLGPGSTLYSYYKFHVPGGGGNSGTISRAWNALTLEGKNLSYNICIHWVEADYVEQNFYVVTADNKQSNVVSVIITGGGGLKSAIPGPGNSRLQ